MSSPVSEFSGSEVLNPSASPGSALALPTTPLFGSLADGMPSRGPDIVHEGFNQTWLMNCLRRRWMLATLMGLLIGAALSGLLLWLFPETSQITSYLLVKDEGASLIADQKSRPKSPLDIQREMMSHLTLIKAPSVLESALTASGISQLEAVQLHRNDAVLWLYEDLKVSFPSEGDILEVSYTGEEDPADMVKIVNAVVEAYRTNVLMTDRVESQSSKDDVAAVVRDMNARLQKKMEELEQKARASGALEKEVELPKIQRDIQMYQTYVDGVRKELTDIEVMRQVAVASANSPAALEAAVQVEMDRDPIIIDYKRKLFDIDQQIESKKAMTRNPNNAELRRLEAGRQQQQVLLEQYRAKAEAEVREKLRNIPNETLRATLVEHKIRFEDASRRLEEYEENLAAAEQSTLR